MKHGQVNNILQNVSTISVQSKLRKIHRFFTRIYHSIFHSREIRDFDSDYYLECYPDVITSGMDPFTHFLKYGKQEGRSTKPLVDMTALASALSNEKETILLISHNATRTGAPILAWNICEQLKQRYNVICVLLRGGEIVPFFKQTCAYVVGPFEEHLLLCAGATISAIKKRFGIKFAIINSYESKLVLKSIAANAIPSIFLIHEFLNDSHLEDFLSETKMIKNIVFPAKMVKDSTFSKKSKALLEASSILPQGKSIVPVMQTNQEAEMKRIEQTIFVDNSGSCRPFVVLGAGTVDYRKGVDLFFATAIEIFRLNPVANIIMIWIGDSKVSPDYSKFIIDQIERYGMQHRCKLIEPIFNLEEVYKFADLFFLSSRLDPLPNVAIDAMMQALPIICFEKTTGIIEFLEQSAETASCILPFSNITVAAEKILKFYQSPQYYASVADKVQAIALENFDMKQYVERLVELVLDSH